MCRRLVGKNALITGGGSGFGQATARRFVQEGLEHVFLVDLKQDRLDRVAREIAELGGRATAIRADVGNPDDCTRMIDTALQADGRLDVLLSNAMAWTEEPFLEMKRASWDHVLNVGLTASFVLGQLAAQAMKDRGGVILYTASVAAFGAGTNFVHYAVAKAGVVNLVRCMAIELAPYNIRVNCVSPGPADTQQSLDTVGEERMRQFRESFPVVPWQHRLARADEIAAAFAYLASEDASYVTGHNLVVDGGLRAHSYSIPAH